MITILRWILLPFSLIYHAIIWVRNLLYDYKFFKSKYYNIPTIVIGNLAIGGTGKSPMTEYLIRLLQNQYKLATLSRGYGRKTKGFRLVETSSQAIDVGDEPLQFKRKFPDITVAVNENRCVGVEKLQANHDVIILDDAFQHRKLKPGFSILLFDFQSLFNPIIVLPTGNFRDIFSSTQRADLIIITKCPDVISDKQKAHIEHLIRKHNTAPIFYSRIGYDKPLNITGEPYTDILENKQIVLCCGIANPQPLMEYLEAKGNKIHLVQFPDHHNYSQSDYNHIKDVFNQIQYSNKIIITTEKDIQRINKDSFRDFPLLYIPIYLQLEELQRHNLEQWIKNYIYENLN